MDDMLITRFGHAAILIEAAGARILVDPGTFSVDATFALTGLDAIVVTHQHPDHLDPDRSRELIALNPDALLLADPETASTVEFGDWTSNADGVETAIGGASIRGVGSQHAEILPTIPRIANVGVLVSGPDEPTLFHPGDTYEYTPAGVDLLALPLSAPWAKSSETVDFVQRVSPGALFPIHDRSISEVAYGIYWGQVCGHGGVEDCRLIDQTGSLELSHI